MMVLSNAGSVLKASTATVGWGGFQLPGGSGRVPSLVVGSDPGRMLWSMTLPA